jgi:sodium pump decarboxylase gamma subunit
MNPSYLLMAVSSEALTDGLLMMIVGMTVVFTALILIMIMLKAMHLLPSGEKPALTPARVAAPTPKAAPSAPAAEPVDASGIAPEIVAVISAAVIAVAGTGARVRGIRLVRQPGRSPWVELGRSLHHLSHRIQRGKR